MFIPLELPPGAGHGDAAPILGVSHRFGTLLPSFEWMRRSCVQAPVRAWLVAFSIICGAGPALAYETSAPAGLDIDATLMRVHPFDPTSPTTFDGFVEPYADGWWLSLELDFTNGSLPVDLLEATVTYKDADGGIIEALSVGAHALAEGVLLPIKPTPSFGNNGGAIADFPGGSLRALDVDDSDDGILAVGTRPGKGFLVARFEADGSLSTGFNGNGKLAVDFEPAFGKKPDGGMATGVTAENPFSYAVGGFVVDDEDNDDPEDDTRFWAFARFDLGGNFVEHFGGDGRTVIFQTASRSGGFNAIGEGEALPVAGIALLGTDVIAVGIVDVDDVPTAAIARIGADGELAWLRTAEAFLPPEHVSYYVGVAIDSEDRIYAIGTHGPAQDFADPQDLPRHLFVVRYEPTNGFRDPGFAPGEPAGVTEVTFPGFPVALAADLAIDTQDRVVVAANLRIAGMGIPTVPGVARLTSSGTLDPDFHNGDPLSLPTVDAIFNGLSAVSTDVADRIVGVFTSTRGFPHDPVPLGVFRLTAAGVLDQEFGGGGVIEFTHPDRPGLAYFSRDVQHHGSRIIVGGVIAPPATEEQDQEGFAVVRLLQDGRLDSNAVIPAGSRVILVLPDETLPPGEGMPLDQIPYSLDVSLTLSEDFAPITWANIQPKLFMPQPLPGGGSYIFPLKQPINLVECEPEDGEQGDDVNLRWWVSHGHEFSFEGRDGRAHRVAITVDNGTVSHAQRYAYDLVVVDDEQRRRPPGTENDNDCHYTWGQDVVAVAAGNIVTLKRDDADNPPGEKLGIDGNSVTIDHGNGEVSVYLHLMQGSVPEDLATFPCPPTAGNPSPKCTVDQGDLLGQVGNSGNSSAPHLHFHLRRQTSLAPVAGFPTFFNNVFVNGLLWTSASLHSGDDVIVGPAPLTLPPNPVSEAGIVIESEPNDALGDHHAVRLPVTIHGTISPNEAPTIAVGGDAIEDIYRIDLPSAAYLSARLFAFPEFRNLDLYVVDEAYNLQNPPGQGTSLDQSEEVMVLLEPGAYYVLVTERHVDVQSAPRPTEAPYVLSLESLQLEYEYAAKFVCGVQADAINGRLARGSYATAINIHNPNVRPTPFLKKVALTYPPEEQAPGIVERLGRDTLRHGEALATDCPDIEQRLFPNGLPEPYIKGFVVIQSPRSLDVTGVYTTTALNANGQSGDHSSIDIEQIQQRHIDVGADLEITQEARFTSGVSTPTVIYTISVTNRGPKAATGVVVEDRLVAEMGSLVTILGSSLQASHAGGWTQAELIDGVAVLAATIPALPVSETAVLSFAVVASLDLPVGAELRNVALVTSTTLESNPDNNTVSLRTTISP